MKGAFSRSPGVVLDVGAYCGGSALRLAQHLPGGPLCFLQSLPPNQTKHHLVLNFSKKWQLLKALFMGRFLDK